jgi:hypothetical protein
MRHAVVQEGGSAWLGPCGAEVNVGPLRREDPDVLLATFRRDDDWIRGEKKKLVDLEAQLIGKG